MNMKMVKPCIYYYFIIRVIKEQTLREADVSKRYFLTKTNPLNKQKWNYNNERQTALKSVAMMLCLLHCISHGFLCYV